MEIFTMFLISLIFNLILISEFFIFWRIAVKQYEGFRNFFARNFGYGYLLIKHPEGRLKKVFIKLSDSMRHNKESYISKSDRVYNFEGLPTLVYNKGNIMPLDLQSLKSDELWQNAAFLDNIHLNTKAAAEAEADAKNGLKEVLLWVNMGLTIIVLCALGYLVYLLTNSGGGLESIIQANV